MDAPHTTKRGIINTSRESVYKLPLIELEVPTLLVNVTDTDPTAPAAPPVTVNGKVRTN
jgi:hypothetical protein